MYESYEYEAYVERIACHPDARGRGVPACLSRGRRRGDGRAAGVWGFDGWRVAEPLLSLLFCSRAHRRREGIGIVILIGSQDGADSPALWSWERFHWSARLVVLQDAGGGAGFSRSG